MSFARRPAAAGLAASVTATVVAAAALSAAPSSALHAQVTTTATLAGRVTAEAGGAAVPTAQVTAVHRPSGTTYRATVRPDGRYTIPGMRVGGPYAVTVRALGFAPVTRDGLTLTLGTQADLNVALAQAATRLTEVTVSAAPAGGTLSAARTGAATSVNREAIQTLPTISRTIQDFTRLTPQASANGSFAGLDSRFNNTTIDGAQFNNAFGLGTGQPGGRTGVSPIPLDAVDQLQVNVAPFDVRQGSFVGASVNAVTRSGTNTFEGSAYYFGRNERFVGRYAGASRFNPGTFKFGQVGARLGGPILRDRLFFFASFEDDGLTQPGTVFRTNAGGETVTGNTTRVLQTDAQGLSDFLAQRFQYQTGPVGGYSFETPSRRALARLDFNANDANKFSLRYTLLNSSSDFPPSNSNSLGFGNRRGTTQALSYANSGYAILENLRSVVGEWNAQLSPRFTNNFLAGYTTNDESRKYKGSIFPTVDILDGANTTYLNFGFEPFTPANQLRYHTYQAQDNLTAYAGDHELTFGASVERYRSENVFFPGSQSVYVYNTLADFYADANGYLANPARTTSPVTLRRFEVRYNNIPGQTEPLQPLAVTTAAAYAQDQWRATPRLTLTAGVRVDVPRFGATAFANAQANALTFRDERGNAVQYQTQKLPDTRALFSPRLGFNLNARGDRETQVRGGTGVFSGRPAYVWISNQLGQNGILTGFEQLNNTTARPFSPDPDAYKPANVTGAPAASYELNFTDKNFRFPQQWRSNLAVDQRLPGGVVATGEVIYGRDLNGVYYINANLPAAQGRFGGGVDNRPRYVNPAGVTGNPTRVNQNITAAYVLKNQDVGYNYSLSASLEKQFRAGLFVKAAYNYGVARNTVDPGSIASGSYNGNAIVRDPNSPGLGYSASSPGHRAIVAASYRREYFRLGATTLSLFGEFANANNTIPGGFTGANTSYVYGGDMNGDGASGNDLIYVPGTLTETQFLPIAATTTTRAFTAQEQQDAWWAYVNQDDYLRSRRGRYAERNAVFLPGFFRADLGVTQEVFRPAFGKRNALQLRLDVFNVTNYVGGRFGHSEWGVGKQLVSNQPISFVDADPSTGAPRFRMRVVNGDLLRRSLVRTAGVNDVFRVQLGARYTFQ